MVLVLDAQLGIDKQDLKIAEHTVNEGRVLVLAVNKWDAVKNKKELTKRFPTLLWWLIQRDYKFFIDLKY